MTLFQCLSNREMTMHSAILCFQNWIRLISLSFDGNKMGDWWLDGWIKNSSIFANSSLFISRKQRFSFLKSWLCFDQSKESGSRLRLSKIAWVCKCISRDGWRRNGTSLTADFRFRIGNLSSDSKGERQSLENMAGPEIMVHEPLRTLKYDGSSSVCET